MKYISSKNNSIFKNISKLSSSSKKRKQTKSFLVEGIKFIEMCHSNKFNFIEIIICSEIISNENLNFIKKNFEHFNLFDFSKKLFDDISYKKNEDGILAIVQNKNNSIDDFKLSKNPYILVVESPEKPGNIGALLRTADAAGMDGLIIANPKTELYNPNTIRSSLGSLFSMQIATDSTENVINFLTKNDIQICSTYVEKSKNYLDINYSKPSAIVIGKESSSLTSVWRNKSDELISIPMKGKMDSLNLSVCAAIVIFEGLKQRDDN
ncbi:MAG: TrmH family RNA methyltransferase [Flavobacteriaceae bacterium]